MSKRILWSIEVTGPLNKQLEDYIEMDSFKTKSYPSQCARTNEFINHIKQHSFVG